MNWLSLASLVWSLAPELRNAIASLIKAIRDGDDDEARRAYEAARRVAFIARQR